jgi:hypothetical protein
LFGYPTDSTITCLPEGDGYRLYITSTFGFNIAEIDIPAGEE